MSRHKKKTKKKRADLTVIVDQKYQARQRKTVSKEVKNLIFLLGKKTCGQVDTDKPEDGFRILFENVISLGVFTIGEARGRELRQVRYLLHK